jgi:PBP1b-binding outer membrane lipoprotein LpoB
MKSTSVVLALATLILSACSSAPQKPVEVQPAKAAEPAKPTINPAKQAVWTSADSAIKAAREAAKAGDSAGVVKNAAFASAQAKAGLAQLSYPTTEQK